MHSNHFMHLHLNLCLQTAQFTNYSMCCHSMHCCEVLHVYHISNELYYLYITNHSCHSIRSDISIEMVAKILIIINTIWNWLSKKNSSAWMRVNIKYVVELLDVWNKSSDVNEIYFVRNSPLNEWLNWI